MSATPEPLFTHIDHVGIAVPDLDAAIAFYEETYGMALLHEETNEEQGVRGSGPVVLKSLGIADLGTIVQAAGGVIAVVGLAMAAVALWLRRSVKNQTQLRDVEIDRRLRGRSEMEAELVDAEMRAKTELTALGLPDLPAAEDLLAREDAHIAQIDLLGAQLDGLVGKEPPSTLVTMYPPRLAGTAATRYQDAAEL